MIPQTKYCPGCKMTLDICNFGINKSRYDGLQNYCKSCRTIRDKQYSEVIRKNKAKYYKEHKNNIIKRVVERYRNRYKTDLQFKLSMRLRGRIRTALKNNAKSGNTLQLLGCTIEEFKRYLEDRFDENMSWENYGKYWHIDHIKPCAIFDFFDPEQQKECFNYTNMQPLEAGKNFSKNSFWNGQIIRKEK